jgi:hypothetical protein
MPRLYADEIGPRLCPEAKISCVGITHPYSGSVIGAVGNRTASDFIENDDVVLKKCIREREASLEDRRWMTLRRQ